MMESGQILRMWNARKTEPRSDCFSSSEQTSLGFGNVISAFALFGGSVILVVVIFIVECIAKACMRQREAKKSKLYKRSLAETLASRALDNSDNESRLSAVKS